MPIRRDSRTPNIPHRSPFRIRDSQMAKIQESSNGKISFFFTYNRDDKLFEFYR